MHRNATTISILSDNVLLEIFDRCRKREYQHDQSPFRVWKWHLLVRVCQRWRQLIFASPRRLDLHLLCKYRTPVRKYVGIWPTIPIIILFRSDFGYGDEDNVIAGLKHRDRASRINLYLTESHFEKIATLMQEPYPVLTHLSIISDYERKLTLPGRLLGGSAPSLQQLDLCDVLYPELPELLLSAGNLVSLNLRNISPSGYISPEAMVSHVAALPKLKILDIEFVAFPDLIPSPPITRTTLPALWKFSFCGACQYLEDFVSRIDTPQLNSISVDYWRSGDINIDVSQLSKFINHSEGLKRSLFRHCKIIANQDRDIVRFFVGHTTSDEAERWNFKPGISVYLDTRDRTIWHLTYILSCIFPTLSDVVHCIVDYMFPSESASLSEQENQDGLDWTQLICQLSSLQTLFVSGNMAGTISQALAYVDGGMITEVFPALKLLYLGDKEEDQPTPSVHKFLGVRRESGHPVTFVKTKAEFEERLKSYP
jgi:hypothetical protein